MLNKLKNWYRRSELTDIVLCTVTFSLAVCVVTVAICGTVVLVAETVKHLGGL